VRAALQFLRARFHGWKAVAKLLHVKEERLSQLGGGKAAVTASLTFRVARLVKVGVDDILAGKYPPEGACPYCGHVKEAEEALATDGGRDLP
jgi:hypothetical protein